MILHVPFTCPVCIESILLYPGRSDLSVRVRDRAVLLTRSDAQPLSIVLTASILTMRLLC